MKITPLDPKLSGLNPVTERRTPANRDATGGAQPSATVEISDAAKLASQNLDAGMDMAKVDRMSQAIRDGSFKVNADAIADKLIANAREQLAKTYR